MNFFVFLLLAFAITGIIIFISSLVTTDADTKTVCSQFSVAMLVLTIFGWLGIEAGRELAYREAVTNGVATYEQVIDKDGSVSNKFVWKK